MRARVRKGVIRQHVRCAPEPEHHTTTKKANELIQPAKQHKNNSVIKAQNPYRQVHTHYQTPTETHILDLGPQLHIAAFLRLAVRIDQVLEQFRGQYVSKKVLLCLLYFLTKKRAKLHNLQRAGREYLAFLFRELV